MIIWFKLIIYICICIHITYICIYYTQTYVWIYVYIHTHSIIRIVLVCVYVCLPWKFFMLQYSLMTEAGDCNKKQPSPYRPGSCTWWAQSHSVVYSSLTYFFYYCDKIYVTENLCHFNHLKVYHPVALICTSLGDHHYQPFSELSHLHKLNSILIKQ